MLACIRRRQFRTVTAECTLHQSYHSKVDCEIKVECQWRIVGQDIVGIEPRYDLIVLRH